MDEDTVTDDLVGEGSVDISKFRTTSGEQQGNPYVTQNSASCFIKVKKQDEFN